MPIVLKERQKDTNPLLYEPGDRKPTWRTVVFLSMFAVIGGFLFGYDTGIISGSMLLIRDYYDLSTLWQSYIVSVTVAAAAIFSIMAGQFTDTFGRKPIIMFASVVFTIGAIVMGIANGPEVLLIGRFVVGAGVGTTLLLPCQYAVSFKSSIVVEIN